MTETGLIGQTIAGRFQVTGFIGEGAMASVYRALQAGEPRDVALKVMHPHLARDATFVARFRREAKAAALLKHPNTVHIVDYGVDREWLYIAMELITGQDLFEVLVVERRMSEARAARIVADVCSALGLAHGRGIVHRDLKPENVMLISDPDDPAREHVKVLDFGIAKVLDRDRGPDSDEAPSSLVASALTTVGVVVGTPAYMSPEQCRAEPVDARADVYSCGILLYQLITGRTPFTGESPIEIAINQVRTPPDPPSKTIPSIHPRLEQIILMALEKWPAQRQQSAEELRQQLRAILPELSERLQPLADGRAPPPPEVRADERPPVSTPRAPPPSDDLEATIRREESPVTSQPHGAPRIASPFEGSPMSAPVSAPMSSDPSIPFSVDAFPRPIGAPIQGNAPAPSAAAAPAEIRAATQPSPFVRPRASTPAWLILLVAVLLGVGVGIVAHFVTQP